MKQIFQSSNLPTFEFNTFYSILFLLACLLLSFTSYSQPTNNVNLRADVSLYSQADKILLKDLMLKYITADVIDDHCAMSSMMNTTGGVFIQILIFYLFTEHI